MEVMRRPRLYADRKWLEGYVGILPEVGSRLWARAYLRSLTYKPTLTARECGEADALLDAFGC